MAFQDFSIAANRNFTVSDQALAGRNAGSTAGWSMDNWGKLHNASAELDQRDVLSGSPSVGTYQTWWSKAGLYLYTNP